MAWIPKNSATLTIERREQPYLTPELLDKVTKEIMPRYATGRGALMTTLHEVQHEYGYIPWQAMIEISKVLGITPAQVADVVSFYEDYRSEPMGKYIIGICQSVACEVCGHQALMDHVKQTLGIDVHETTGFAKKKREAIVGIAKPISAISSLVHSLRVELLFSIGVIHNGTFLHTF